MIQGTPLATGTLDVPPFNRDALISTLRTDQAGKSTFPEFLAATWRAGVIRYDVDFVARTVAYYGCNGEEYVETYALVGSIRSRVPSDSGVGRLQLREAATRLMFGVVEDVVSVNYTHSENAGSGSDSGVPPYDC